MSEQDESSLGSALEALLNEAATAAGSPGVIEAQKGSSRVRAEVVDVDRLGVVVERLRIDCPAGDLAGRMARVAASVRPAGQHLKPIEMDERLGGGTLRTTAEHMMRGRFYQVGIDLQGAELARHRRDESGQRTREKFTLTREHLGRLVDELSDALSD